MTNKHIIKAFFFTLFIVFLFHISEAFSQSDEATLKAIKHYKLKSDSVYGLDMELANGPLYYQMNLYAFGDPFFGSSDWFDGSVTIHDISHDGLKLKYDIEVGQIILLVTIKTGLSAPIVLYTQSIERFSLGDFHFISTAQLPESDIRAAFALEIYRGSFTFLASYRKSFLKDYNAETPYGKYSEQHAIFYIFKDGLLTKISSKGSLLSFFENDKKEINKYIKRNRFKFKKATIRQWAVLMEFCDNISGNPE